MTSPLDTASLVDRFRRTADADSRNALVARAVGRIECLARTMLRGDFARLGRWVDTGDVLQGAATRLFRALDAAGPQSSLHFHRLIALQIRRELIDLVRRYFGPEGPGANHDTGVAVGGGGSADGRPGLDPADTPADPAARVEAEEINRLVLDLPDNEAAVTDLLYYQGLTKVEAAAALGVSEETVRQWWLRARRSLGGRLGAPG
ncbi:MAG TPA: sigma-70 family RNA polymerase sigma factor [Urbifossiella sp.]|nr:sigma-70 family RNA polymerase sigma factor [Urbifossiella sp.]